MPSLTYYRVMVNRVTAPLAFTNSMSSDVRPTKEQHYSSLELWVYQQRTHFLTELKVNEIFSSVGRVSELVLKDK